MPEVYGYATDGSVHELRLSAYESHLTSRLYDPAAWVVFAPHRHDLTINRDRNELIGAVQRLLNLIDTHGSRLDYRYSIHTRGHPSGRELSGSGGFGCRYNGETGIAEAGAGFCHIKSTDKTSPTAPTKVLADLRDMQPVVTDDGITLVPRRRKETTSLRANLEQLLAFLQAAQADTVQQTVEQA